MEEQFAKIQPVFPAYAGVILKLADYFKVSIGIPRVCGGDPYEDMVYPAEEIVFPAYAGVIPSPMAL
ncbi:hypothetical protein JCM15457_1840 [Liquorilactobacillus sucicola DSM 21376 = JCM 15457]|uniref:Uncharacterized protein n=1 Tax=Liquorilactobacillus sucicola DSM 21376 = JCM 15457 TaxID=1423806 RepID=A0A023CYB7_9LACO|nr:hypothetical protein FD15_GL000766 [Liquorilactobacillus sucicola DSM 21376 = JCM 15457]GAJ26888.1 hypothetical protein JCM15457_1840 [Liquorilactobacillus sucicola DSM 21376 = JCM 15457]